VTTRADDVAVACFQRGWVIEELAHMLVAAFVECGSAVRFVPEANAMPDVAPRLVVLVGQGPEFEDLGWVRFGDETGGRPKVVFWGIDPLPPPGLPADVVERQLEVARLRERVHARGGSSKVVARVPKPLKALVRRVAAGPSPIADEVVSSDVPLFDARTFYRLHWIKEQVTHGRIDVVAGTNGAFVATLREQGIEAECEPVGYSPMMGRDEGRGRDIDVLFLGGVDVHRAARAQMVEQLRVDLSAVGLELFVPTESTFGAARSDLLNRAKTIVNLRSNAWHPELVRFTFAAACGTAIVTNLPITNTDPFVDGRDFLSAETTELAPVLLRVVSDGALRARVTRSAHELVTHELTMASTARRMLERVAS
jgi:hypothetical protein